MLSSVWAISDQAAAALEAALMARGGDLADARDVAFGRLDQAQLEPRRGGVVAVVPVLGEISQRPSFWGTSTESLAQILADLEVAKDVVATVLSIDSPGGTVYGVPEAASIIRASAARKPIVSIANTFAASAAYWLGSQATEMLASPSAEVGSIGVYVLHLDMSAALEKEGLRVRMVKAGKHKAETSPYAPLTDEAEAYLQEQVDRYYGMFVSDVAKGRKVSLDAVRSGFGEGRVVGAKQAVELGMVDSVGTLADAVRRAASLAQERKREAARVQMDESELRARACLAGLRRD